MRMFSFDLGKTATGVGCWVGTKNKMKLKNVRLWSFKHCNNIGQICFEFADKVATLLSEPATDETTKGVTTAEDVVAVERPWPRHQYSAEIQYAMRGVLAAYCWDYCIQMIDVTPTQLKKAATGSGKASKIDVTKNVIRAYPTIMTPGTPNDVADAIAVGMAALELGSNS